MRYFGGKSRIAKQLSTFLKPLLNGRRYREPFVGGAWMLTAMDQPQAEASDACRPLIALYQALKEGWLPPTDISEETYKQAQQGLLEPPLQAFIGFGCSFGGKWFGGYARTDKNNPQARNYAQNASNSLLRKLPVIQKTNFVHRDYRELNPQNELIYCDPPYAGTTGYIAVGKFDWNEFWGTMRKWSLSNSVYISSYEAPEDFKIVLEITTRLDCRSSNGREKRIEKLFTLNPF